jgi:hypothetical protein
VKYGIDYLLPKEVELVHGPGCPVCVTPLEMIDRAHAIARQPGVIFCSFGDMLRVPGSNGDLFQVKAGGADVRIVYSPLDCLRIATANPSKKVVFFAIGFETTEPANAMAVRQLEQGRAEVENQYGRVVNPDGNMDAQRMIRRVFEVCDRAWRGIGVIPKERLLPERRVPRSRCRTHLRPWHHPHAGAGDMHQRTDIERPEEAARLSRIWPGMHAAEPAGRHDGVGGRGLRGLLQLRTSPSDAAVPIRATTAAESSRTNFGGVGVLAMSMQDFSLKIRPELLQKIRGHVDADLHAELRNSVVRSPIICVVRIRNRNRSRIA